MVSDSCSSIAWPWVEISTGCTYMCVRMGYADASAMSVNTIANSFPTAPRFFPYLLRAHTHPSAASFRFNRSLDPCLVGLRLENEVDGLRLASRNRHFLRLVTVRFVPCSDRVLSRRQVGKRKIPLSLGHGI